MAPKGQVLSTVPRTFKLDESQLENIGNLDLDANYDFIKIRRRCEDTMRTMNNNPLLLQIAIMLNVKLH